MKKSYLMIAAAAALFVACAETDTIKEIDTQDVAIGFGSYINNATRAELTNSWFANSDENSFGVYGFKIKDNTPTYEQIFDNEQVTWNDTQKDWKHPTVRFWDKSKSYNFYAYAPYEANATFTTASQTFSFSGLELIQQIDATNNNNPVVTDIAIAINQGVTYESTLENTHATDGASAQGHHTGDVEFVFNHILSKLAFKVKSTTPQYLAKIRVTEVKIDFPTISSGSASWTQTSNDQPDGTTTIPALTAQDAIAANGTVTVANFSIPVFTLESNGVGTNWLSTTAADIVEYTWANDAPTTATENKANEYIVVPVESGATDDVKGYEFAIKVVYDIQYMKLSAGKTVGSENLDDYEEDMQELGCIATGKITADNYDPEQNEFWTVTIDVNPAKIEFCVDKIEGWDTVDGGTVEVK